MQGETKKILFRIGNERFFTMEGAKPWSPLVSLVYLFLGEGDNYRNSISLSLRRQIYIYPSLYYLTTGPSVMESKGVFVKSLVIIQQKKSITQSSTVV